ncbi:MAG: hypothetical protein P1P89_09710 [Desulfobacterales bacterium]|nr:hypothetical protein [Desulfobacterales bacterium]
MPPDHRHPAENNNLGLGMDQGRPEKESGFCKIVISIAKKLVDKSEYTNYISSVFSQTIEAGIYCLAFYFPENEKGG